MDHSPATTQRLKQEIFHERRKTEFVSKSIEKWKTIFDDIRRPYQDITKVESEMKLRYLNQKELNETIRQHIRDITKDIMNMRKDRKFLEKKLQSTYTSRSDYRVLYRQLEYEKSSLNSMVDLCERQLDREFTLYSRAKESAINMMKELRIVQRSLVQQQQASDRKTMERLGTEDYVGRQANMLGRHEQKKHLKWKTIVMKNKALVPAKSQDSNQGYTKMYLKRQKRDLNPS